MEKHECPTAPAYIHRKLLCISRFSNTHHEIKFVQYHKNISIPLNPTRPLDWAKTQATVMPVFQGPNSQLLS